MIVGFLGVKQSGKDTSADFMVKRFNFEKMHFAQPIKEACAILFNFNEKQLYGDLKEEDDSFWKVSPRVVMQYLGTDVFRKDIQKIIPGIGDSFWVNVLIKKYQDKLKENSNCKIVIADVRFQNEIDTIHTLGGIVIKIVRASVNSVDIHESEKNIENLQGDYLINNDGSLEDLYNKLENIVSFIELKKLD